MGLDMPEMGALGYNNVDIRMHSGRMIPQAPLHGQREEVTKDGKGERQ
jgi:hypothetical protein